jgi:3,4-dihydroxy 2-butanone 4-phosphate synthase/GTP cyclohydrolase II
LPVSLAVDAMDRSRVACVLLQESSMGVTNPIRVPTHSRPVVPEVAFLSPLFEQLAQRGHRRARTPFVTLSYAQSIDGSIAARPAHPVALSSEKSFLMTHVLRSHHCGLLVGINTILSDDPQLTVRLCDGDSPRPIVLDSHLRIPEEARVFARADSRPLLLTTAGAPQERIERLQARGATVRIMPADASGRVALDAALRCLAAEGVSRLMVEGGATVIESFLQQRLVDYCVITVAPKLMFGGLKTMDRAVENSPPLSIAGCAYQPLDGDLIIHGPLHGS